MLYFSILARGTCSYIYVIVQVKVKHSGIWTRLTSVVICLPTGWLATRELHLHRVRSVVLGMVLIGNDAEINGEA